MPHIKLPDGLPGILGPLMFRPETAKPLVELAEVLLRGENSLTRGERELIAAYVSSLNECHFCTRSHGVFAALQLDEDWELVESVKRNPATAQISDKLKSLLAIAARVQQGGLSVSEGDVSDARKWGATDTEIHDTVLIAAAFCMFNRYVDGLGTWAPPDGDVYVERGRAVVQHGYLTPVPQTR